jgi:hypothetical protein
VANKTYSKKNQEKLKIYLEKKQKNGSKNIDTKSSGATNQSNSRGTRAN